MFPTAARSISAFYRRANAAPIKEFKAKRPWPPDFTKLPAKHQFRLEKRYKRRAALKWARPGWNKAITLIQWGSISFVLVYGVFFLETDDYVPFETFRKWTKNKLSTAWSMNDVQRERQDNQASASPPVEPPR